MKGIFVELSDVQKIFGFAHKQTAHKRLSLIRDVLGKHNITVREFCQYEDIAEDDFYNAIKQK